MIVALAALLGLVFGSVLTALISRQAKGERWATGRSHCPKCRHPLAVWDLVPVLSYLVLDGKCRYCRGVIGASYPLLELATAALFALAAVIRLGPAAFGGVEAFLAPDWVLPLLRDWAAIVVLVQIFLYDLWFGYILDQVTLPAIAVFLLWNLALGVPLPMLLIGAAVGGGFFLLQYVISGGKWIGGGDIRLGALMGVLLGWPLVLVALFIAYLSGGAVGAVLLASKRKTVGSQIPFGTFLSAATVVVLFWGRAMLDWYLYGVL
ncbi:prepilin peptidase [Patescibacteria group bacterium]|nr:MAG: prepilin peptidase [Patescibacteria group bacterium]